jgi:DNA-binding CsgD family transcriptional regulator
MQDNPLTALERQAIRLMAQGNERAQAAELMSLSLSTFNKVLKRVYVKLDSTNTAGAVAKALTNGYIYLSLDDDVL